MNWMWIYYLMGLTVIGLPVYKIATEMMKVADALKF